LRRELGDLRGREFDLVIVGGGISGLCVAWDASQRGLSVALLESRDFAHAASANSFKMIHGGIRYLQHADLVRVRTSARERGALMRIAPHLTRPLPIFIPTYGHGLKGREILMAGMKLYDLLTADRNRGISDPARRIPATRSVSRARALELFPALDATGLTGGAVFCDGQMVSPARLALAFGSSAAQLGAVLANHCEVTGLLQGADGVKGVIARDRLEDRSFEVRGRIVLNAAGGWAPDLLATSPPLGLRPRPVFSRDACFFVRRAHPAAMALAVTGSSRDPQAVFSRSARHLFLVPWRGGTLVGVWHAVWNGDPSATRVAESELLEWIAETNAAMPSLELELGDVALTQCGLVLFAENEPGASDLKYGHRSLIVDHAQADGVAGLITLVSVRYTIARTEAAKVTDLVFQKLGRRAPSCRTGETRLFGGDFESFDDLVRDVRRDAGESLPQAAVEALAHNHGSNYTAVLSVAREAKGPMLLVPGSATLEAEILHAVRREAARTLSDVALRRTDLGAAGHPGAAALEAAATLMARELHWDATRRQKELDVTSASFPALTS
jgi:glycerol-3-phosphate dehydrogenase